MILGHGLVFKSIAIRQVNILTPHETSTLLISNIIYAVTSTLWSDLFISIIIICTFYDCMRAFFSSTDSKLTNSHFFIWRYSNVSIFRKLYKNTCYYRNKFFPSQFDTVKIFHNFRLNLKWFCVTKNPVIWFYESVCIFKVRVLCKIMKC